MAGRSWRGAGPPIRSLRLLRLPASPPPASLHHCLHLPPQFVADLYAELSAMKLGLRSRARAVVARYWQELEARRAAAPAPGGAAAAAAAGGT